MTSETEEPFTQFFLNLTLILFFDTSNSTLHDRPYHQYG